jgi:CHAD domain-containing protein
VAGDDHGLHQARVATRRLREAVPVLASGLKHSKAGKAERKIRRLTRALGTVRELDVALLLLDGLAQGEDLPRTALDAVRAHVAAEREHRRSAMLDRLEGVNVGKLGRRLASVAAALRQSDGETWRDVLLARLMKRAGRLRHAVEGAGQMYVPEPLHEVRIAAKKLRYGLELAAESGISAALPLLRPIKRSQALLGRLHDLQVLLVHIGAVQASRQSHAPGMHAALEVLSRHVEGECRRMHGRYLMSSAALQEACDAVAALARPKTAVTASRRPLKMGLGSKARALASGTRR